MSRGSQTKIWATAYHEAGHALAALREGREVTEVRLYPDCPDNGLTAWNRGSSRRLFRSSDPGGDFIPEWHELLQERLADIRISLAGPLAEAKLLNKPLRSLGAESDLSACQSIAHSMAVRHRQLQELIEVTAPGNSKLPTVDMLELIDEQRRSVRRWVGRPAVWNTLKEIAEQLIKSRVLNGQDLIRGTLASDSPGSKQQVLPF